MLELYNFIYTMSFVKDLQKGLEAEKIFAKYLIDFPGFISIEFSQGKFTEWDLKMTTKDKVVTYEIKNDLQANETGNIAIEYRYKGKAKGIYESKADYIVYHAADKWYIQERAELLLRIQNIEKRTVKGGDGYQSELYLIKVEKLPELFENINVE